MSYTLGSLIGCLFLWQQELLLYLLQLVQALKYENFDNIQAAFERQQEQQQLQNEPPPRFVVRSESTGSATTVPSGDTTDSGGGVIDSDR